MKRPEIIRKRDNELHAIGNGMYTGVEYYYNNRPFTGFVILDFHANGNIASEQEYVNGQIMGWDVRYYENGEIEYESLEYGATGVLYREFDVTGELIEEAWLESKKIYNKVAELTGIEKII